LDKWEQEETPQDEFAVVKVLKPSKPFCHDYLQTVIKKEWTEGLN
jgi:hypothetical protein